MAAQGIKIVVEAVDRVSRPFRQMFGAIRSVNLAPLRDQIGRVATAAKTAGAEIGRMGRNAGIAVAGVAAAAGAILLRVARSSNEAANAAERLGISMRAYQSLGHAAKRSGAEVNEMGDALKDLNTKVLAALNGNKELASGFKRMGVSLRDANGNLRPTEEIFVDLADAFARVPDGAKKSAAAMALMGENGLKMIPLLNLGADGLRDLMAEAERLGLVIDEDTAAGFATMQDQMQLLGGVLTGLQNQIAGKLLPIFLPLIERFTDFVLANRELIATRIVEWIEKIPAVLTQAEAAGRAWLEALTPIGTAIGWVVELLGPFHSSIGLVSAVVGGKLLVVLWPLLRALSGLGLLLTRMTLGPLIGMFVKLFSAVRAGMGVMAAFNLVLTANPIGAVIAAIAALAGAAYLIYRNWGAVSAWFGRLWAGVKRVFNGFVDFVTSVFTGDLSGALDAIEAIYTAFADFLATVLEPVVASFRWFVDWVGGVFGVDLLGAFDNVVAGIGDAMGPLVDYLAECWTNIRAVFEAFGEYLTAVFTGDFTAAVAALRKTFSAVVDYLVGAWSPVTAAFEMFLGWFDSTFGTNLIGHFESLKSTVSGLVEQFTTLWQPVQDAFAAVAAWVGDVFAGNMQAAIQRVYDLIKPIIDTIAAAITAISNGIAGLSGAASWAGDKLTAGAGAVSDSATSVWNYFRGNSGSAPESHPVAANQPTAFTRGVPGAPADVDVGGKLNIHVTAESRAIVKNAEFNNPNISADVSAGPSNVTP